MPAEWDPEVRFDGQHGDWLLLVRLLGLARPLAAVVRGAQGGSSELPFEPAPVSGCRFRSRLPSRVSHCLPPSRHRHDHRWARRLSFPGRACAFHVNHGGALPELRLAVLTIAGVVSREPKNPGLPWAKSCWGPRQLPDCFRWTLPASHLLPAVQVLPDAETSHSDSAPWQSAPWQSASAKTWFPLAASDSSPARSGA